MEHFDFDDYLEGSMPLDIRLAFDQQLIANSDLRHKFRIWEELRNSDVSGEKQHQLRLNFQQGLAAYRAEKRKKRMLWLIAAVLIALSIGFVCYYARQKPSPAKALYVAHFQPNIDFSTERSGTTLPNDFQKIEEAYARKNYGLALKLLEQNKPSDPSSAYELLIGQLWLIEAQADSAIVHLNRINIGATEEKHWFLALAYLLLDDVKSAEKQLLIAEKGSGPFAEKAKRLLIPLRDAGNTE